MFQRGGERGGGAQAATGAAFLNEFGQSRFEERGATRLDTGYFVFIPVNAGYMVTQVRQAGSSN